ncbi:MAG: ATP-binding cassette domain-containing protein [Pseudomonadota bacterium]
MIHIDQLTKYYDGFCAVDGISLNIPKGEILGLLGPNGAGKTTTLRMLTGYLKASAGAIQVKDFNMTEHPLEIKQLMGYLPESAPLYHGMLVYDYLRYVARIRGLEGDRLENRIRELADICAIGDIMHRTIGELSKGLKQRVGLAHAMMSDPEILVLDEPTSGLDPNQIVEIREIIRHVGKEKTVILSTHILSEAEATCDRIVIINKGRIIADGTADELKHSAGRKSQITVTLADAPESAAQTLGALDGVTAVTPVDTEDADTRRFKLDAESGSTVPAAIYRRIKETDWTLLELHRETHDLETIFRELTREN